MATEVLARVTANAGIKSDVHLLTLAVPPTFANPLPGQFVMLRPSAYQEGAAPFLPRPFSVCGFENGQLEIIYRIVGKGTAWLAGLASSANLFIRGPLGNSFVLPPTTKRAIMVTGGIGVAPLLFFASHYRCRTVKIQFLLGLRGKEDLLVGERLNRLCDSLKISTDDGSCGVCGHVTALLPEELAGIDPQSSAIYACGPKEMLRSLARMTPANLPCFVSLEERMGCGIGACLGCAVAMIDSNGKREMKRVCKDGPVFDIRQIDWE